MEALSYLLGCIKTGHSLEPPIGYHLLLTPALGLSWCEEQLLLTRYNPKTFIGGWTHILSKVTVGEIQQSSAILSPSTVGRALRAQHVQYSTGQRGEGCLSRTQNGWRETDR